MTGTFLLSGFSLVLFASGAWATPAATGFENGNVFEWTELSGQLQVTCQDPAYPGMDFQTYNCRKDLFDPGKFARFVKVGSQVDADHVQLNTTWKDGSKHSQTERYDSSQGASRDTFNLWVMTLFQDPLLEPGANTVHYLLTKTGKSVASGSFQALVNPQPSRECPWRSVHSWHHSDCQGNDLIVCDDYFYYENNCQ